MADDRRPGQPSTSSWVMVALAWLAVGIPLLWGIWTTLKKAVVLFR
jgi:hypothetical protein